LACEAASCLCRGACSLCGTVVPMSAIGGRIVYSVFFFVTAILAWAVHTWGTASRLHWLPKLKEGCDQNDLCYETEAVYRISATVAVFHLLMALLMIGVRKKGDIRHSIQDGWWGLKLLLMAGTGVGFFFVPNKYFHYYSWVALVAAGFFIIVQLVYLVDFAHSWAENWIGNFEDDSDSKKWLYFMFGATGVMIGLILAGSITSYVYFHAGKSVAVTTFNILFGILIHFLSVHPKIQEVWPRSGLLQPAVVTLYTTWLVWSANLSDTSDSNPFHHSADNKSASFDVTLFIGALFTTISILYATISTASHLGGAEAEPLIGDEESGEKKVDADEPVAYNYSVFHIVFALGAMYVAMLMTDWSTVHNPGNDASIRSGTAAFWVKSASALVCFLLYVWTLVAPALFPDREWGNNQ